MKEPSNITHQPPPPLLSAALGRDLADTLWITVRLHGGSHAVTEGISELRLPYYYTDGGVLDTRILRTEVSDPAATASWSWKGKAADAPYGISYRQSWDLSEPILILPSELDAVLAWRFGFQAVSPGAGRAWQTNWDEHLAGAQRIVFLGGEFPDWLSNSDLRGRAELLQTSTSDLLTLAREHDADLKTHLGSKLKVTQPWKTLMESHSAQAIIRARQTAEPLLGSSNLLEEFEKVLLGTGFAGDVNHARLVYLAFTSRLLDRPVSLAIKGASAAGKSYAVDRVSRLMPDDAYLKMTGMSPASLYYSNESLAHRILLINEADGIDSRKLAYTLRSLLTEGELQLHTTRATRGGGREGIVIKKEGPVGVITTTTGIHLHAETETRLFSLTVADDTATTARMISAVDQPFTEEVVRQWQALQECIAYDVAPVHIPYLGKLLSKIPPVALRLRRDKILLIGMIQSHALLHRHKRALDEDGRIVAIWADYEEVRRLLNPILSEMVESTVSPQTRETVEAVMGLMQQSDYRESVSITDLAVKLGLDKSTVSRRVASCVEAGYLVNETGGRGRRACLLLGDPLPAGRQILPSKRSIQEG